MGGDEDAARSKSRCRMAASFAAQTMSRWKSVMAAMFSIPEIETALRWSVIRDQTCWIFKFSTAVEQSFCDGYAWSLFRIIAVHSSSQRSRSTEASRSVELISSSVSKSFVVQQDASLACARARITFSSTWDISRRSTMVLSGWYINVLIRDALSKKVTLGGFSPSNENLPPSSIQFQQRGRVLIHMLKIESSPPDSHCTKQSSFFIVHR